jgi:hypothetical protein
MDHTTSTTNLVLLVACGMVIWASLLMVIQIPPEEARFLLWVTILYQIFRFYSKFESEIKRMITFYLQENAISKPPIAANI